MSDLLGNAAIVVEARDQILAALVGAVAESGDPAILVRLFLACAIEVQAGLQGMETVPGLLRAAAEAVETASGPKH